MTAGLAGVVVFAGFRDDLDHWMPNADLFVLPSFTEGLPNVLLEAHAAGVPVVATAVGGTPELVVHGETGLLVHAGDDAALADNMANLLSDDDRRRAMGDAARVRVREQFTFEVQALGYLDLFKELFALRCAA
jgi:glycosyltransferase involved in cell wall biosynthesis